jgi:hypothetical protein
VDLLRHIFKQKFDVLVQLNQEVAAHEARVRKSINEKASRGDEEAKALKERNKLLTKERVSRLRERNKTK